MTSANRGPVDGLLIPRYGGLATFAHLSRIDEVAKADVAIVGMRTRSWLVRERVSRGSSPVATLASGAPVRVAAARVRLHVITTSTSQAELAVISPRAGESGLSSSSRRGLVR